jgi:hypothetical protein
VFKARSAFVAGLVCCAATAAFALPASAATTIGAPPQPNPTAGGFLNCPWGYASDTQAAIVGHGQTIVVPSATDTVLDSFSLYIAQLTDAFGQLVGEPQTITYKAYVAPWDGSTLTTGAPVWQSDPLTLTTSSDPAQWETTVPTGGVELAIGQQYAIYFATDETNGSNTPEDLGCGILASGNVYADGGSLLRGMGGAITNTGWQWGAPEFGSQDVAFKAMFSAPVTDPGGGGEETVYTFDGFYAPVNNKDAQGNYILNGVKAGSAIPVKFSLGGDYGLDVFEADYPKSQAIECTSSADVDGIEETVNAGGSSLSYAAGSDTYNYVWKTDKAWADSCRQLVVKFDDGTTARANFKFH